MTPQPKKISKGIQSKVGLGGLPTALARKGKARRHLLAWENKLSLTLGCANNEAIWSDVLAPLTNAVCCSVLPISKMAIKSVKVIRDQRNKVFTFNPDENGVAND